MELSKKTTMLVTPESHGEIVEPVSALAASALPVGTTSDMKRESQPTASDLLPRS